MAQFQLGRVFSDVDVDIIKSQWSGRTWQVEGDVLLPGTASSRVGQGEALREQVVAIANNPDEPVVAVRWAADPSVDGYYRVLSTDVDIDPIHLTDGTSKWRATLERLSNHQYSPVESVCSWNLLVNSRGITTGTMSAATCEQFAFPSAAWDIGPVSGTVSGDGTTLQTLATSDTATLKVVQGPPTLPSNGVYGWSVAPCAFYTGSCRVTTTFGTAADQLVFGRRQDGTTNWKAHNGVARVSLTVGGDIRIEHWDGTAWRQVNSTDWRVTLNGVTVAWATMAILRNSPEEVVIRIAGSASSVIRTYLDLNIKRGSRMVYGALSTPASTAAWPASAAYSVQSTASVACTAITGGMRATTADGNGHQLVLVSAGSTDTVATGRTTNAASSPGFFQFGISAAIGSVGTTFAAAQQQAYEFFARRSETMRVVAR